MKTLFVIGVLGPLIPMLLVSGISLYHFRVSYHKEIQERLEELVQQGTRRIDSFLKERLADMAMLTDTLSFEQLSSETFLQARLNALQAQHGPVFSNLEVFDEKGLRIAHAGPVTPLNARLSESAWYRGVKNTEDEIGIVCSYSEGMARLIMAAKKGGKGKDWILRTTVDRDAFSKVVKELGVENNGYVCVMSRDGACQIGSCLHIKSGEMTFMDFLGIQQGGQGDIFMAQRADSGGHETLYVSRFLKQGDWILVYCQSASDVFSGLRKTEAVALGAVLMIGLLIIANALSLSKKMIRRIQQADKEKQKQNEQMFQTGKLASIGELAAGIAHEINNPVAIMVEEAGWIDDLLEEEEFQASKHLKEVRRALGQIRTQGIRCKEITHKLLSFARKTDSRIERFRLNELIEDIVTISAKRAGFNHIDIHTDIGEKLPLIEGSPTEFQQVLLNLINNALDAMEKKGGTLSISARPQEGHIVVEVSDNGPGIPKDDLSHVFDPFFTTKPVGKGTGLGLSICYGIVKKMGGEIHVHSQVNKGTTFTVRIPLHKTNEDEYAAPSGYRG
jgi:two-component system NtrC family sensor kinase